MASERKSGSNWLNRKKKKDSSRSNAFRHNGSLDLEFIQLLGLNFREGNGNPLQYSCLENPTDGGAW